MASIKKYAYGILFFSVFVFFAAQAKVSADTGNTASQVTIVFSTGSTARVKILAKPRPLSLGKFLMDTCDRVGKGTPAISSQVHVYRSGVQQETPLYTALQKCVYLGLLEQHSRVTDLSTSVSGSLVTDFLFQKFNYRLPFALPRNEIVTTDMWENHIHYRIPSYYNLQNIARLSSRGTNDAYDSAIITSPSFPALAQIYSEITQNYHYTSGFTDEDLLYGAVQGMVQGLHDQYSVYFPPEGMTDFLQGIQEEYYGIGTYVDVVDGKFTLISIIPGSPAEQAGLLAGDVVTAVDDWTVPQVFTVQDVVGRIKGPVGSSVKLTIQRQGQSHIIQSLRQKISLPLLTTKVKNSAVIFTISSFGLGLTSQFEQSLQTYKSDIASASNIVIDLRNNGGGYLDEAIGLLNYFVPAGEVSQYMEYKDSMVPIFSQGSAVSPFTGKNIYILINGGTASASEILATTIKDYYPQMKFVGEKSFGKGCAQTIVTLPNGGSVKYTIALWYSGRTKTSIEKKGITPDILVHDDPKTAADESLQAIGFGQ